MQMRSKCGWRALILVMGWCVQLDAMDRWAALSMLESGDDHRAIGSAGEVSRYQMRPEVWRRYARPHANWRDRGEALRVAQRMMAERCAEFERSFARPPTDFEFYILWNAPAQVQHPSKTVAARAKRFCNLVADPR